MSRSRKPRRYGGEEWWGKRPFSGVAKHSSRDLRQWKHFLHKTERRMGRDEARRELSNL